MNYVFYSGKQYDSVTGVNYGAASNIGMNYAVQWYVYDAQGNYITTVLSAGIADVSSNNTDTYIGKQLEDMGYAVDGKSVAICYDKPRYMYGDWGNVSNSANSINSGPDFDAYRFEGQWIAAATTDTVRVNVEVAMMTDSGEVLANSNTAGYGNATASLVQDVSFGKPLLLRTLSAGTTTTPTPENSLSQLTPITKASVLITRTRMLPTTLYIVRLQYTTIFIRVVRSKEPTACPVMIWSKPS